MPPVFWHMLTSVTLALTVCACAFYTLFFFNPQNPLNPFPPPTRTPWVKPTPVNAPPTLPGAVPTLPPAWTATPLGGAPVTETPAFTNLNSQATPAATDTGISGAETPATATLASPSSTPTGQASSATPALTFPTDTPTLEEYPVEDTPPPTGYP